MNYSAAKLAEYPSESSSVNHSSPQQAAGYSGSRIKMIPSFIGREKLVHQPGIYIFRDKTQKIIYVGKALDLSKRVSSYFSGSPDSAKTANLITEIASLETIVVESELEVLILEANLIKKHLPIFNIRLTDDKDFLYLKITKEANPRVLTARKHDLGDAKKYFGPYPSSRTVKETLKKLRRIFRWCSSPKRGCFYVHLNLCSGVCKGRISSKEYNKNINRLGLLLEGKSKKVIDDLEGEMRQLANEQNFEGAANVKRMLEGLNYLTQSTSIQGYLENPNFLQNQNQLALRQLQKVLNLPKLPSRIEAYDISNISGKQASGSLVVLTDGEIDKSQYRKFKIQISGKPNDYAMHRELMARRLTHPEWPLPQLFLIDGGRGQVRAVELELSKRNIKIAVFGLAKREEWLYPADGEIIKLPKHFLALRLLQKIRDEAHRFAVSYHRKLRQRAFLV